MAQPACVMNIIESACVAYFGHFNAKGKNLPLAWVLEGIKGGRWRPQIEELRAAGRDSPAYDKLKEELPCFMLSATTKGGHKIQGIDKHTGFLQIDIDKVGADKAPDLRDRIGEDHHISRTWVSSTGDGVKAIMLIPADVEGHKAAYDTAEVYMLETYGVRIDPQCSNVNRLCYVSHDPDLVENRDAVPLEVAACSADAGAGLGEDSSTLLNLHSTSYVLRNTEIIRDFPNLEPLYLKLIARRFPAPSRGTRNQTLTEIVPFCFYAFSSEFVPGFAEAFFKQHAEAFGDYDFGTYQSQVQSLLTGCQRSYVERLTGAEKSAYERLRDDKQREAFRIAQSLSKCESEATVPPPLFHLSYEQLAARLGLYAPMQAKRILLAFISEGIIQMEKKGTARAKGVQGVATVYRWML